MNRLEELRETLLKQFEQLPHDPLWRNVLALGIDEDVKQVMSVIVSCPPDDPLLSRALKTFDQMLEYCQLKIRPEDEHTFCEEWRALVRDCQGRRAQ